ncbi:MAG: hypothetical protein ACOC2Z_16810 [Coleofasciculus sp.]
MPNHLSVGYGGEFIEWLSPQLMPNHLSVGYGGEFIEWLSPQFKSRLTHPTGMADLQPGFSYLMLRWQEIES